MPLTSIDFPPPQFCQSIARGISQRPAVESGFTLTEIAIVLFIVALLIGGMMLPLAAQDALRRTQDTRKVLADVHDALLGFATANGRLPCPASSASNGLESYCTNGGPDSNACGASIAAYQVHGRCSNPFNGFVPAVTLGIAPTDNNGYALDGWSGRLRYTVTTQYTGGIYPFTTANGMKTTTLQSLASDLQVCSTSTGVSNSGNVAAPLPTCGTSLTNTAVAVVYSTGNNSSTGGAGADETHNPNQNATVAADRLFVAHDETPVSAANGEFDDIVIWLSPNILLNRMVAAGRLP